MRRVILAMPALWLLQACSGQEAKEAGVSAETETFTEFEHGEPQGEGMKLAGIGNKSALGDGLAPSVAVSDRWQAADRGDMERLVAESASILTDPAFVSYGLALREAYPRVWFSQELGWGDAARAVEIAAAPEPPVRYLPATVVPFNGWASTGGVEGRIEISVNPKLLERWRSPDVVVRACAVNTMAHEITHTLSHSATTYRYAYTDTGVGREARRLPPASYLAGNIALCGHLIRQGRITAADLKKCTAIWYKPKGFQSGKCFAYPGDRPVE